MSKFFFRIGQRVFLKGREKILIVAAMYRVEIWNFYKLQGWEEFLVKESSLVAAESSDAVGFVPRPMSQGEQESEERR